jgi:hypothetical protein
MKKASIDHPTHGGLTFFFDDFDGGGVYAGLVRTFDLGTKPPATSGDVSWPTRLALA